ncbi:MAG: SOS response-associated peptidase [Microbacterium sp.]
MCGRFVVARSGPELASVLRVDIEGDELPAPSFNVAPTARVAIVLDSAKTEPPTRRLEAARWGLVPRWAKDVSLGARAFNARAETVRVKPMFREALVSRRAVVPASGYYEWKTDGGLKTPFYIHPPDDAPMLFAGLYEWWKDPSKENVDPTRWLLSFTILTRGATGVLASIHDRMPLLLDPDSAQAWLDPAAQNVGDVLDATVDAAPALVDALAMHEVDRAVGDVRNDSPALVAPL